MHQITPHTKGSLKRLTLSSPSDFANRIRINIQRVIVGKSDRVELLLVALLAGGHVLLEDVPGTGKTLLAKSLARSLDCNFARIQFTPDLLPSDLTGIHFFNQKRSEFEFRPGPVFTNVLLADEINRATPRTQSSLLECMEERQVTIDGETRLLAEPFVVMATQNPVESQGTFPLPEAQLDRFLLRLRLGYPTADEGVEILARFAHDSPQATLTPVFSAEDVRAAQAHCRRVGIARDLLRYIVAIADASRAHPDVTLGISPRGTRALVSAAQALACIRGRDFVLPDDIKELAEPVLAHRIVVGTRSRIRRDPEAAIVRAILEEVPVPAEDTLTVP